MQYLEKKFCAWFTKNLTVFINVSVVCHKFFFVNHTFTEACHKFVIKFHFSLSYIIFCRLGTRTPYLETLINLGATADQTRPDMTRPMKLLTLPSVYVMYTSQARAKTALISYRSRRWYRPVCSFSTCRCWRSIVASLCVVRAEPERRTWHSHLPALSFAGANSWPIASVVDWFPNCIHCKAIYI